ncbi:MAG: branched-chain amino acid ABC transporter permease [Jatrophihabitantaceae bacterium]
MNVRTLLAAPLFKRFLACLAGSLVLALMWGPQEGTSEDYGLAFHQAIFKPRVLVFLAIGVLGFLAITFWPKVRPYLSRPGAPSFMVGGASVVAAYVLLRWYDPIGDAKLGAVATAVSQTSGLSPIATAFFGWLHWTLFVLVLVIGGVAIARQMRPLAWAAAALSVLAAVTAVVAKQEVASFDGGIDHSLGAFGALIGFLVMAAACGAAALTRQQIAATREAIERRMDWRPGLPLVALGLIVGVCAMTVAGWFSPLRLNSSLSETHSLFDSSGLASIFLAYLDWLAWTLFVVSAALGAAGSYLRNRALGWAAAGLGVISVGFTLVTLYKMSALAAGLNVDSATGPWQNLGVGGWLTCIAFSLVAAGGYVSATAEHRRSAAQGAEVPDAGTDADEQDAPPGLRARASASTRSLILVGVALALFYPPTTTQFWQKVLVSEIGVYVLLAIGLNVVVGWAGLLDLGFIAFYAIGSYTTAFLVGSLPHKPPSWLHMTPLLAIPFAIGICLLAGLALGAPTLRLRGDYLAIVTLGFGEIIRIIAINNPGDITNSTRGPTPALPHPVIHLGPLHLTWGLNNLQYWYLLLFLIVIIVLLFYRLEGSRLGRAWAAVREDEVAAQASGINTTRVKLLAFAIGASTSGVAGVFFASQVGYFNPDNFVLNNSILVVAYVVFGGMGSLPGAMAGAAVLTWLPEFLKDQVPADDRQMWIGAVVLLMMIFRPAGLLPAKRRKAELTGLDAPASSEVSAVPRSGAL